MFNKVEGVLHWFHTFTKWSYPVKFGITYLEQRRVCTICGYEELRRF